MESTLERLHESAHCAIPASLVGWNDTINDWCDSYCSRYSNAQLTEILLPPAAFVFDHTLERVCFAYAISTPQLMKRNASRMRGFPNVNVSVRNTLGEAAFVADRGHFLGHASGGELDINLFPHRRDLNRGWSAEGKRFRQMEAFVATHSGTFFYHGALYDDETWIPAELEYGVLREDGTWWIERFHNKSKLE